MAKSALTKRKQQAMVTRKELYDTALVLFLSHGYDNVTIDEICNKVGLSKGAFYTHFKSKDQIITEYFMSIDRYHDEIAVKVSKLTSSIEKLMSFSTLAMKYLSDLGMPSVRVLYQSSIAPGERSGFMTSPDRSFYKILEKIVIEGQQKKEIKSDISAQQIVQSLVTCYRGIVYSWILSNGEKRLVDIVKPVIAIMNHGLAA